MRKLAVILGAAVAVLMLWGTPAISDSPTAQVKSILDQVLTIQNNPALAGPAHEKERARAVREIIRRSFDFDRMAKTSLGPVYGRLGPGQRREFTDTFSYLFQDSYTRMVLNFLKQETVKYLNESRNNGEARVKTSLVRSNETIPVDYLMRAAAQGWLLYDVIVDGVSILDNYRSQFAQVIRSQSFESLLNKMKTQRRAVQ